MSFILDFPKFQNYTNQDVEFLQPKFDGHLAKIKRAEGVITVVSKNDKIITDKVMSCPQVANTLSKIPKHSILFSELFSTGAATDVPTLLIAGSDDLQLRVFAAPVFSTNNFFNRDLVEVQSLVEKRGVPFAMTTRLEGEPDVKSLLQAADLEGLEGWVLKQKHMKGWYKLKPTKTIDVFVVTINKSFSANNFGDLKSMTMGVYEVYGAFKNRRRLRIVADVGGGWSKEFRETQPSIKDYKFKVCELEYDSFMKNRLRFPRFVRWRDDKESKDCTWDQL